MTRILGIETSCDETAVAVVDDGRVVHANLIATQHELHRRYAGVVPEIAARAHIECLDLLIRDAFAAANCEPDSIDAIAVTSHPGLIGSLLVGVTAAKTLAWAWGKPLIGVNHIEAHATSAAITTQTPPWPAIALVVSGGHTSLYRVNDFQDIQLLGGTIDDAAGEAFDKVAAILQLSYPGGPTVDRRARTGRPDAVALPRTMLAPDSLDFSFSGLKTAVLYHVHGPGRTTGGLDRLAATDIDDICASFSAAVVDVLVRKTLAAAEKLGLNSIVVGGGVAANSVLRERLTAACRGRKYTLHLSAPEYCTDNAAMIAALGFHLMKAGRHADLKLDARASLT